MERNENLIVGRRAREKIEFKNAAVLFKETGFRIFEEPCFLKQFSSAFRVEKDEFVPAWIFTVVKIGEVRVLHKVLVVHHGAVHHNPVDELGHRFADSHVIEREAAHVHQKALISDRLMV